MGLERTYELKLASGSVARWEGNSPAEAIHRYEAMHPKDIVVAWRHWPQHGLFVGMLPIIEAGHARWHG